MTEIIRKMQTIVKDVKYDEKKNLSEFLKEIAVADLGGNCLLIIYKDNEIIIGLIKEDVMNVGNPDEFNVNNVKEIRMFSKIGELHLWKIGDEIKLRLRIDNKEGEEVDIYQEEHFIWGTRASGNLLQEEHRGMKIPFPFDIDEKSLPITYQVRNYFKYNDEGLIEFYDARIVSFKNKGGEMNG